MINESTITHIVRKVWQAKRKALDMCVNAHMGHLTSAYSCAEAVAVLYYHVMRHDGQNPRWPERDRFVMSKNHGTLITYPILADLGYFPEEELDTFMRDNTRLGGHSKLILEGVDFAGGSLGIGLGVATGMAYAAKMDNKAWTTYALLGDGECYEGGIWEAAMFAGHNQLRNLVAVIDRNQMAITDFTENMLRLEPFADKWRAFGWDVAEVDGHSVKELLTAFDDFGSSKRDKPLALIANTVKGNGIGFMSNAPLYHGVAPSGDNIERAIAEIEEAKP